MRLHSFALDKRADFYLIPVSVNASKVLVKVTYPWIHAIHCNDVQSLALLQPYIWQFDYAYLLQVFPLATNYQLKFEELSLSPGAPYGCLILPHCSMGN